MDIRKYSPIDQNAKNLFKAYDSENPGMTHAKTTISQYSIALNTGSVGTVSSIRLTLPGGSATEYALPATYDVTDADGRTACIAAINALLESFGYDAGVGSKWSSPTFTIFTANSEIVFVGLNASGNAFSVVSGQNKSVGI